MTESKIESFLGQKPVHHWRIESPHGKFSIGVCAVEGHEEHTKIFLNAHEDTLTKNIFGGWTNRTAKIAVK